MRDLRRWILVGLAVAVVGVAAVGYGLIASGIATPPGGGLGTVQVPDEPGAVPVFLADGRPAFVVRTADSVLVVDARPPVTAGAPSGLVTWCEPEDFFSDWINHGIYSPDGRLIAGTSGLIAYPVTISDEGDAVVGREGVPQPEVRIPGPFNCAAVEAVAHEPRPDEVFDPSVAAEEEPPGWIWLDGRLEAVGDEVVLCDRSEGPGCAGGAVVRGIDPARLAEQPQPLDGLFIGRIGDGAIDELHFAPISMGVR